MLKISMFIYNDIAHDGNPASQPVERDCLLWKIQIWFDIYQ